jgi:hypothetical protein
MNTLTLFEIYLFSILIIHDQPILTNILSEINTQLRDLDLYSIPITY